MEIRKNKTVLGTSLLMDELMNCGVTYSSITLLSKEGLSYLSKCSDDSWVNIYIASNLYKKCHLMNEAHKQISNNSSSNGFVFLWDNYFPNNEESLHLNALRKEKNLCHGVAFCSKLSDGGMSIITITGKDSDINFHKNVLRNKEPVYKAILRSTFIHPFNYYTT